jgi:hypothetical protein
LSKLLSEQLNFALCRGLPVLLTMQVTDSFYLDPIRIERYFGRVPITGIHPRVIRGALMGQVSAITIALLIAGIEMAAGRKGVELMAH